MLPVTRANLDYICSICLIDIRPSMYTKKVYDVQKEKDLSKLLNLTAHIKVLKNPMNQINIQEYCRKMCELCFVKSQYSFDFREKILASTITLKEILENEEIGEEDIERLQWFCRICLNRQKSTQEQTLTMEFLKWIKDCSGLRFTSLVEKEIFRLKEGTNITELMVVHDAQFPKQLCQKCLKKLRNMEEFRTIASQSFEYMISVMGDVEKPPPPPPTANIQNFECEMKKEIENFHRVNVLNEPIENLFEIEINPPGDIKIEEEELLYPELSVLISENEFEHDAWEDFSDESHDFTMPYEENFLDREIEITQGLCDQELPNHSDPIGKDDIVKSTSFKKKLPRKLRNVNKTNDEKYYSEEEQYHVSKKADSKNTNGKSKIPIKSNKKIKQQTEDDQVCKNEIESILMDDSKEQIKLLPAPPNTDGKGKTQTLKDIRKCKQPMGADKKFNCEKCPGKYSTQKLLNNHVLKHRDKDQPFDCDKCSKTFRTKYVLKRHQKETHGIKEEIKEDETAPIITNTCAFCSQTFKRKDHLTHHIKSVHEKLRPFKCSFCDKSFATFTNKRVHELSHTDTFPFVCDWCAKRFRTSSQLKIHLEIHTTQPELLCPTCKRAQNTVEALQEHLKTHDEKRLQCPSCGKLFKKSSHLRDHQNAVHLKLRPYKCEFCDLAFGDRKTRRVHEKSHTEDRPEICPVCKRGFKSRNTLGRHMKEFGHLTEEFIKNNKKGKKKSQTHQEVVVNMGFPYLMHPFTN